MTTRTTRDIPIEVLYVSMPKGIGGLYDHETRTIYIEKSLSSGKRRTTLEHEQYHAERGDTRCADAWFHKKQELLVERETARRLIPLDELAEAIVVCQDDQSLAEHLDVDVRAVQHRRSILTACEIQYIEQRIARLERGF